MRPSTRALFWRSCAARFQAIARVEFAARAAAEILTARDWWLANRDKAPAAFDEELDAVVTSLELDPGRVGQPQRASNRRRVLLRRVRYYLYFRVEDGGAVVQVLALWHASRGREPDLG